MRIEGAGGRLSEIFGCVKFEKSMRQLSGDVRKFVGCLICCLEDYIGLEKYGNRQLRDFEKQL